MPSRRRRPSTRAPAPRCARSGSRPLPTSRATAFSGTSPRCSTRRGAGRAAGGGARAARREVRVSAATDVTGYGLLGHLSEMLDASGVGAVVRRGGVPVWERSVSLASEGCYPGGLKNNREYLGEKVAPDGVGEEDLLPLYDPQTSGGLLVAVPEGRAPEFVGALERQGALAAVVGEVVEG